MHECRRTFLFAPYALVRSNSMWKQRGWLQPQHSAPNVWCRLHCKTATERLPTGMSTNNYALGESAAGIISPISETATEHLATLLCDSISPIRQTATEHWPNGAILCEDCDEAHHSVLCHATGHAHMVHAARIGSVPPLGQCLRSRSWQPLSGECSACAVCPGDSNHCAGFAHTQSL